MIMNKVFIVLALVCLVFLVQCKHEPLVNPDIDPTPVDPPTPTAVCFEGEVLPIFQSYCAKSGCHDPITHEEGYVLNSYTNITRRGIVPGDPNNSKLYKVLFASGESHMPPLNHAQLTTEQKALINKWITEGAKNTVNCGVACDTAAFTYNNNVVPILKTFCIGCHSASNAMGGVDLSTHAAVKTYALNGKLYGSISWTAGFKAMPQGGNKLSDCQIRVIRKWIDAGSLNN